jgi:type IV pilus assembly protein PilC
MALILTPGQLSKRAAFYHQLAQFTTVGLGLVGALRQLFRSPPSRSYQEPITRMLAGVEQGSTFAESLRGTGGWLPAFDIALIHAGEQSGRLDACFRLLADYYEDRARIARQVMADLAYPVFLLHFAVFVFPFAQFFISGDLAAYLARTFGFLLPLYLATAAVVYAAQGEHGEKWRAGLEALLHRVPVLGHGRRALALSRLAGALEALLAAGVSIVEAWELAAEASGSPALRRVVVDWRPLVEAGKTPSEVIHASGRFPDLFGAQYAAGELSGKLDDTLARLHRYYQEEGSRKLQLLAQWTPRAVYLIVVMAIAYRVLQFWTGYFGQIRDAGAF